MLDPDSWEEGCRRKQREVQRRIQVELTHEEIRELCHIWGCSEPGQFWSKLNSASDDELRRTIDRLRKKRYTTGVPVLQEEIMAYA